MPLGLVLFLTVWGGSTVYMVSRVENLNREVQKVEKLNAGLQWLVPVSPTPMVEATPAAGLKKQLGPTGPTAPRGVESTEK